MKQRFSTRTRLVSALLTLAMVFTFLPFSAFAATDSYGPVYITDANVPDKTFREYLKKFDTNGDNTLTPAERYAVTEIDVGKKNISSLVGIQFFPNLEKLYCYDNQLTELDVSKNTALVYLDCYGNKLTSLDVSKNTNLIRLSCFENQLTELDVRQNAALEYLYCYENQLTELDVSRNNKIFVLEANNNYLTSLNVDNTSINLDNSSSEFAALGNTYPITVGSDRTFDLSTLPGTFDVTKATRWNGGTVRGNTLTVKAGETKVTYLYNCGKRSSYTFTLNVTVVPDGTVTPPEPPVTPPEPPVTPPSGDGDGGGAVVIVAAAGAVAAGVVGYGVYNYVSGRKLQALLPEGVAAPENRAQTALLLWNTAGRPEPAEAPAFADVADPDTAKAAQWCVEQGLMKRRLNGKFAPGSSIPAYQVLNAYRKLAG